MAITITEALAEIKLIEKKIESKKVVVLGNLTRFEHMPDPYVAQGGSQPAMLSEVQAIGDLYKRLTSIRSAIAKANLATNVTVGTERASLYHWLVWKREVAKPLLDMFNNIHKGIKRSMDEFSGRPQVFQDPEGKTQLVKMQANLSYSDFVQNASYIQDALEKLDGQLSLKNAVVLIEV